jgi:hypothetical protein
MRLFGAVEARRLRGGNGFRLPPDDFRPALHCRFRRPPPADDLTHYKGVPAGFGGSDETVER